MGSRSFAPGGITVMADTDKFSDKEILARTIWGEARGEFERGMEAVACVILNRVKSGVTWWGTDIRSVCLKPWQFSCWNHNDPNRAKLLAVNAENPDYDVALDVAQQAIDGQLVDSTNGAINYKRIGTPASWANDRLPCAIIGHHEFYA